MASKTHSLRITWVSLWLNIGLGVLKCVVGLWANSRALIADGLHSLVDLSTDIVAILGLTLAAKPVDGTHPYGHQKLSSLAGLFISVFLLVFCAGLILNSIRGMLVGEAVAPGGSAMVVAAVSLIAKEWLFRRTREIATQERSQLAMTNAVHHRADSVSSLLVLAALIAIGLGGPAWHMLDKGLGLILGAWLGGEGIRMFLRACQELIDTAPEEAVIGDLREHVLQVNGALAYHQFRARRLGDMLMLDLHLQVDPNQTVAQGHAIAEQVKAIILDNHPEVLEVLVHVEPADERNLEPRGVHDLGQ